MICFEHKAKYMDSWAARINLVPKKSVYKVESKQSFTNILSFLLISGVNITCEASHQ